MVAARTAKGKFKIRQMQKARERAAAARKSALGGVGKVANSNAMPYAPANYSRAFGPPRPITTNLMPQTTGTDKQAIQQQLASFQKNWQSADKERMKEFEIKIKEARAEASTASNALFSSFNFTPAMKKLSMAVVNKELTLEERNEAKEKLKEILDKRNAKSGLYPQAKESEIQRGIRDSDPEELPQAPPAETPGTFSVERVEDAEKVEKDAEAKVKKSEVVMEEPEAESGVFSIDKATDFGTATQTPLPNDEDINRMNSQPNEPTSQPIKSKSPSGSIDPPTPPISAASAPGDQGSLVKKEKAILAPGIAGTEESTSQPEAVKQPGSMDQKEPVSTGPELRGQAQLPTPRDMPSQPTVRMQTAADEPIQTPVQPSIKQSSYISSIDLDLPAKGNTGRKRDEIMASIRAQSDLEDRLRDVGERPLGSINVGEGDSSKRRASENPTIPPIRPDQSIGKTAGRAYTSQQMDEIQELA